MSLRGLVRVCAQSRCSYPLIYRPMIKRGPLGNVRFQSSSTLQEAGKLSESEKVSMDTDSDELEITTGMIGKERNETVLYFDNLYPKISQIEQLGWAVNRVLGLGTDNLTKILSEKTAPRDLPVSISKIIPREKDGGVFVKFAVDETSSTTPQEAEQNLIEHFAQHVYRPWYKLPFNPVRVFPVRGTPWIEDLRRSQSNKIKVAFGGDDLSQEALYSVMRRYGPIVDIIPPAPGDSAPRCAVVSFSKLNDAATARNCVNGLSLRNGKTKLHISFVPFEKKNAIRDWIVDHPRIVIPVLVALLATMAVIIFEPIRVYFVRHKITGQLVTLERYPTLNWIKNRIVSVFSGLVSQVRGSISRIGLWKESSEGFDDFWEERRAAIGSLKQWIDEGANTFVVVHGPRGSGKQDLVFKHALAERNNILTIDCDTLVKARSDSGFIKTAASMLGYYPVFSWMNSITQFMDLAVQGLTGQKTGFAESIETQFKNMLSTTASAISQTAMEKKGGLDTSDENYLQLHPENKPVVVVTHLVSKSEESNAFVYNQVVEWAATLIQANIAHVIFVTDDVGYEKVLNDALPNQIFKLLPVGDANTESAKAFVEKQFRVQQQEAERKQEQGVDDDAEKEVKEPVSLEGLDEALLPLGGRMTDLQAFARRLKSGETPSEALEDMIEQAKIEVLQMYVMKPSGGWSKEQAWTLIKLLASADSSKTVKKKQRSLFRGDDEKAAEKSSNSETKMPEVAMETLANDSNFASPDSTGALSELEHAEMVSLHSVGGRIISVRAGKPLYQAAFKALVHDRNLNAWMESHLINNLIAQENATIKSLETELTQLAVMPNKNEIKVRIDYVAKKLYASQKRIEAFEKQWADQQKILGK